MCSDLLNAVTNMPECWMTTCAITENTTVGKDGTGYLFLLLIA